MTARDLEAHCSVCGAAVARADAGRGARCPACFAGYLRGIDDAFLDNLSRFGVRGHRLVAETCLRALVLADVDDRKLLGMTIYERFVLAASDLIALHRALRRRREQPIARTFLEFTLDAAAARAFFAELALGGPAGMLAAVGLPAPLALPPTPDLDRRGRRDLEKSLREALRDLDALAGMRDLGERALAIAVDHLRGATAPADRTQWLAGRAMAPNQVASIALDAAAGRLDIATLRVDEGRLEQVVDGIDVITRISRNLIHAYLTLRPDGAAEDGFAQRPAGGATG